jgi:predicted rRNA methylase YqxC with S4 and FtsJ domains
MPKIRLDVLMVECGLVGSRALAQRLVLAGQVLVDGAPYFKAWHKTHTLQPKY